MSYACSAKIEPFELTNSLPELDVQDLALNNGVLVGGVLVGATDLVYRSNLSIEDYIVSSFLHAANDLFVSGVLPRDVFFNLCLNVENSIDDRRNIIFFLKKYIDDNKLNLVNAHTVIEYSDWISFVLIGEPKKKLMHLIDHEEYSLVLTKKLGSLYFSMQPNGLNDFVLENLTKSNQWILELDFCEGSVDVSGYGLMGSLSLMSSSLKRKIEINLKEIPIVDLFFERFTEGDCTAKRNFKNFSGFVQSSEIDDVFIQLLYGSELNGGIVLVMSDSSYKKALSNGYSSLYKIGSLGRIYTKGVKINA